MKRRISEIELIQLNKFKSWWLITLEDHIKQTNEWKRLSEVVGEFKATDQLINYQEVTLKNSVRFSHIYKLWDVTEIVFDWWEPLSHRQILGIFQRAQWREVSIVKGVGGLRLWGVRLKKKPALGLLRRMTPWSGQGRPPECWVGASSELLSRLRREEFEFWTPTQAKTEMRKRLKK